MNEMTIFDFKGNNVRTINKDNEPWFVAADVCKILDIKNPTNAIRGLDDDEKNTLLIKKGNRGNPNKSIVSESGLYALIFQSRKEEAKVFRKFVTGTVLPTIRKTGGYISENASEEQLKELVAHIGRLQHSNAELRGRVGGLTKGNNSLEKKVLILGCKIKSTEEKAKLMHIAMRNTRDFNAKFRSTCCHCGKPIEKGSKASGKLMEGGYKHVCHRDCFESYVASKISAKLLEGGYFNE